MRKASTIDYSERKDANTAKLYDVRFLIQNSLAFNHFDSSTWIAACKYNQRPTYSSTTMKRFVLQYANELRNEFRNEVLAVAPGVSVSVDEWSDRQRLPWMGITITVVDLDFNLRVYSPGMQLIDGPATSENLLMWLKAQLDRMGISTAEVSSICNDNAASISKAIQLDPSLSSVAQYCMCHLLNIAVKNGIKNATSVHSEAATSSAHEDQEVIDLSSGIEASTTSSSRTHGDSHDAAEGWVEEINEEDATTCEITPDVNVASDAQNKRVRIPSARMVSFIESLATQSDFAAEPHSSDDSTAEDATLSEIASLWPSFSGDAPPTSMMDISELVERCREITKHVVSHTPVVKALEDAQDKTYSAALKSFRSDQNSYEFKFKMFQEEMNSFTASGSLGDPPQPPEPFEDEEPVRPRRLAQDIPTRWNSLLISICRIIENYEPLEMIWPKHGDGKQLFDEDEWKALEAFAQYLLHFETLTHMVQGDHVLASEAILVVRSFKWLLHEQPDDHPLVKAMKAGIQAHLGNHRSKLRRILAHDSTTSLAAFCACIDPRSYKLAIFKKNERRDLQRNFLDYATERIIHWKQRKTPSSATTNDTNESDDDESSFISKRPKLGFVTRFSDCEDDDDEADAEASEEDYEDEEDQRIREKQDLRRLLMSELRKFQKDAGKRFKRFQRSTASYTAGSKQRITKADETKTILAWWRSIAHEYPNLRIVAAILFSVRVTSASSERLFSFAALIRTARRNLLGPVLFDAMVCVMYNDPLLQQSRLDSADLRTKRLKTSKQ